MLSLLTENAANCTTILYISKIKLVLTAGVTGNPLNVEELKIFSR